MTATLRERLADYLAVRRALGYLLVRPKKLLSQFLDYRTWARPALLIRPCTGAELPDWRTRGFSPT